MHKPVYLMILPIFRIQKSPSVTEPTLVPPVLYVCTNPYSIVTVFEYSTNNVHTVSVTVL